MIKATIYRDNKYIRRYTVKGHANFDEYGRDIVCAAVSVLTQNTLISLVKVVGIDESEINYSIDNDIGFIDVILDDSIDIEKLKDAQILLESMLVGLNSIKESYPKYMTVKIRGV